VCPRVGILSKGKLITEGTVESLGRNMLGGGKYRIELELEKVTGEIVEKLKKLDKVLSVIRSGNQLQIMSDKDIRQDISRFIAAEGILLTKMDMKQDALEEIYLKYFKEE
jgi:ABC-type multidrug transport system ATPase subunit